MASPLKPRLLQELRRRYGELRSLVGSFSLFEVGNTALRVYVRYSRIHPGGRTFFGLREEDLAQLEGLPSVIAFLWDDQQEPLFVPFADYEEVFRNISPARDGQYKAQVCLTGEAVELYIATAGRFNVESHIGWEALDDIVRKEQLVELPELGHSQIQTLLATIGDIKGFDIWIPPNDRQRLHWPTGRAFEFRSNLAEVDSIGNVVENIDVIWLDRGSSEIKVLFEVEHTTPIYSGLLRFNDIRLAMPQCTSRYTIVADEDRRVSLPANFGYRR